MYMLKCDHECIHHGFVIYGLLSITEGYNQITIYCNKLVLSLHIICSATYWNTHPCLIVLGSHVGSLNGFQLAIGQSHLTLPPIGRLCHVIHEKFIITGWPHHSDLFISKWRFWTYLRMRLKHCMLANFHVNSQECLILKWYTSYTKTTIAATT